MAMVLGLLCLIVLMALPFGYRPTSGIVQLPETPAKTEPPDFFSILNLNLGFCAGLSGLIEPVSNTTLNQNLSQMIQTIQTEDPDIVCLQEVDFSAKRSGFIAQHHELQRRLKYPYMAFVTTWNRLWVPYPLTVKIWRHFGPTWGGQIVLSKFPITNQTHVVLQKPINRPFWYNHFYLNRVFQKLEIQIRNKTLILGNVHLEAFDKPTRVAQAQALTPKLDPCDLLAGDFNAVEPTQAQTYPDEPDIDYFNDETLAILTEKGLQKTFPPTPEFLDFPSNSPNRALCQILYNPQHLSLIQKHRIDTFQTASDHLGLEAIFSLNTSL